MFERMSSLLSLLLAVVAAAGWGEAGAAQAVSVERGHWPVLIEPLSGTPDAAGICSELGPKDVALTWKGEPLEVTAIGPRPLPRLHALLIDASGSMNGWLRFDTRFEEAKKAALEYIDAVPDGDTILVASFNENLVMGAAPSRDKEAARRAARTQRIGYDTALWDSLGYLISYLDTLHGEKVIVLLSDGEDHKSTKWRSFEEVVELAAGARNLSIFPIGLGVSQASDSRSRYQLGALAERTGGEFFEIRMGETLGQLFKDVLERLASRLYLAYIPGEDSSGGKVRVRARKGLPCRIVSLGSPAWMGAGTGSGGIASRLRRTEDKLEPSGLTEAFECLFPEKRLQPAETLTVQQPPLTLAIPRSRDALVGRAEERVVAIATPPLAVLLSRLAGPEELLLFMLEEDFCAPAWPLEAPFMLDGRTFLELRELLGQAMFTSREDYRSWAIRMVEGDVDIDLSALLTAWGEERRPSGEELRRLRSAMIGQAADPSTGRPYLHLSEWLGDLPALEVVSALESRMIDSLIGGRGGVTAIESSWHKLGRWFPAAVDARIIAPLVPAYDPEREAMGFYRFVLPAPRAHGRQPSPLSPRPLALMLTRRLMEHPEAARLISHRLRAAEVRYGGVEAREFRRHDCPVKPAALRRSTRVETTFADVTLGGEALLRLVAYFPDSHGESGDPLCLWFEGEQGDLAGPLNGILAGLFPRRR